MAVPFARSAICPILIGRSAQLRSLDQLLDELWAGRGRSVLISGEAGIGKSRLVAELRANAACGSPKGARATAVVLEGRCFEPDRTLPYGPFRDLLRTLLADRSADEIARDAGSTAPELARLLPELAATLPNLDPRPALDPEGEKRRLFHALGQLFARLAARQPVLVIIEDLHWSDDTSLEFLLYLLRRGASRPILLLMTYRDDEVHSDLGHFLAEVDRGRLALELPLSRLSPEQLDQMLRAIFERERPVRAEFLDALHALTDGNPFFVEEVVQSLIASGEIVPTDDGWDRKPISALRTPRSVQDAVQRRLQHVSPTARDLVALAAVAGRHFDFSLLQQLLSHDEPALLQLIKELIAAQLVVEESADRFGFRHELTRQAIYSGLLARERRALHRRIAETLERVHAAALDAHLGDLADHYYRAGAWDQALEYARRAGRQAQDFFSPRAAIEHFTQALDVADRVASLSRAELLRPRGEARAWVGDFEGARQDHEAVLELAVATADRATEWQALVDLGTLWVGRDYARGRQYHERAIEVARDGGDQLALAHSLNCLGHCATRVGEPFEAQRHHQQALAIFQAIPGHRGVAETLEHLGISACIGSDLVRGAAYLRQALDLYRERDDRPGMVSSLRPLSATGPALNSDFLVPAITNLAECVSYGEQAVALACEIGWRSAEAEARSWLGFSVGAQGDYERALRLARTGLSLAEEIEHRRAMLFAHLAVGACLAGLLALPAALPHLEQSVSLAHELHSAHFVTAFSGFLASAMIEAGKLARAEALLDATLGPSSRAETFGERKLWSTRAELALAAAEPDRALELADWLIATAPNSGPGPERTIVRLAKLRGEALTRLGRDEEAEAALLTARDAARAQGAHPHLWRIRAALGSLYRSQERHAEAERECAAARIIVEELAAGVQDQALRDNFLRQASRLVPRRADKLVFGGLTARERQVAALIARGKPNGAIAEALVISKRTVESHVSAVLTKLGLSTREQIAAWADEHGL